MLAPSASILRAAESMFSDARGFEPAARARPFALPPATFLDPLFLPQLVAQIKQQAPHCRHRDPAAVGRERLPRALAQGDMDVVIGNWLKPPDDLHLGRLFGDEVVCLVARDHPAVRRAARAAGTASWLAAEHIAPTPTHPGARGVIDEHLDSLGLQRNITARCPHFGLIPSMVASTLLVLTTGRQYCERYVDKLPVKILPCPVPFPRLLYYQLWHERTHASSAGRWLRERVKSVAASLRKE
jgi:DNA-binding transcriptional LysR family regulator